MANKASFSEFHYYGWLTKFAENGMTDPRFVDGLYKAAVLRVPAVKKAQARTGVPVVRKLKTGRVPANSLT